MKSNTELELALATRNHVRRRKKKERKKKEKKHKLWGSLDDLLQTSIKLNNQEATVVLNQLEANGVECIKLQYVSVA